MVHSFFQSKFRANQSGGLAEISTLDFSSD
jgi:hypothetical protein